MNTQIIEALQRIKDEERWLEIHGLIESIDFTDKDLESDLTRNMFDQIKLYERK